MSGTITRLTAAEYNLFDETNQPMALIDGHIFVYPVPPDIHQQIILNAITTLHERLKRRGRLVISPIDIRLDSYNIIQPDLLWISGPDSLCQKHVAEDRLIGPPDLVIEVLDEESVQRDRVIKLNLYAKYGVLECWLLNPENRTVEVFQRQQHDLVLMTISHDDFFSPLLHTHFHTNLFYQDLDDPHAGTPSNIPQSSSWSEHLMEVIEGEVGRHIRELPLHGFIARAVTEMLRQVVPFGTLWTPPTHTRLSAATVVQPDVCWTQRPTTLYHHGGEAYTSDTPDLVCEILCSATVKRDRQTKFALYEKHGVREYWLLDPINEWVEVFTRKDDTLVLNEVYHKTTFTSPLLRQPITTHKLFSGWNA